MRGSYQATDGFRENSAIQQTSVYAGLSHESEKGYFKLFGFLGREKSQSAYYAVEPEILEEDIRFNPLTPDERDRVRPAVRPGAVHALPERDDEPRGPALRQRRGRLVPALELVEDRAPRVRPRLDEPRGGPDVQDGPRAPRPDVGRPRERLRQHAHPRHRRAASASYINDGNKSEASTFVKLARDSGPWHFYGDAQLRWARFRYEGSVDLEPVSWTFFNPKLGVAPRRREGPLRLRLGRPDEPRAGTRRPPPRGGERLRRPRPDRREAREGRRGRARDGLEERSLLGAGQPLRHGVPATRSR